VLGAVAVLSKHGVDVVAPLVRPTAGHIVPVVVGAVVAAEIKLPLALKNGERDGARWRPLGEVALRQWQRFRALLDVVVEQRPLRRDRGESVPAGRHVSAVRQVPRRRDEDVVVGENLGLLGVEVRRPRVATAAAAAAFASLVVVRHRSSVEGDVEEGEGRGETKKVSTGREQGVGDRGFL
jgi:hypothetical protein